MSPHHQLIAANVKVMVLLHINAEHFNRSQRHETRITESHLYRQTKTPL